MGSNGCMRVVAFPVSNADKVDKKWKMLKAAMEPLLRQQDPGFSSVELYRVAFDLFSDGYGAKIYNGYRSLLVEYLTTHLQPQILRSLDSDDDDVFLQSFEQSFTAYKASIAGIKDILTLIDRIYAAQNKVDGLQELSVKLFRDHIINSAKIGAKLHDIIDKFGKQDVDGKIVEPNSESSNLDLHNNVQKILMEITGKNDLEINLCTNN